MVYVTHEMPKNDIGYIGYWYETNGLIQHFENLAFLFWIAQHVAKYKSILHIVSFEQWARCRCLLVFVLQQKIIASIYKCWQPIRFLICEAKIADTKWIFSTKKSKSLWTVKCMLKSCDNHNHVCQVVAILRFIFWLNTKSGAIYRFWCVLGYLSEFVENEKRNNLFGNCQDHTLNDANWLNIVVKYGCSSWVCWT